MAISQAELLTRVNWVDLLARRMKWWFNSENGLGQKHPPILIEAYELLEAQRPYQTLSFKHKVAIGQWLCDDLQLSPDLHDVVDMRDEIRERLRKQIWREEVQLRTTLTHTSYLRMCRAFHHLWSS